MKKIKWKILIITSLVCLSPILLGIVLWDKLPESMAIHFDINNNPDNFASKEFTVFGIPLLMAVFQVICCITNDLNAYKHGEGKKIEIATKWTIPVITVILQIATFGYGLGWDIDIRRVAVFVVGVIFLVTGNYLPKLDYIKNYDLDTDKARKINRFIGIETVVMGALFLISIFLPPVVSLVCVILLIPYVIISIIYGITVRRKNKS